MNSWQFSASRLVERRGSWRLRQLRFRLSQDDPQSQIILAYVRIQGSRSLDPCCDRIVTVSLLFYCAGVSSGIPVELQGIAFAGVEGKDQVSVAEDANLEVAAGGVGGRVGYGS